MNRVLPWIKSNIVTVIMLALMVAAVVTAPILAGRWSESVRREAESRAARLTQITSLQRTSVNVPIPGRQSEPVTTVVNPQLLERYREVSESLRDDAELIRQAAIAFNRKERGVLEPRLFPVMPPRERNTLPVLFPEKVAAAYEDLLRRVRAGAPPSPEDVVEAVATREEQFISNNLRKQSRSELDAAELRDLRTELTKARLAKYAERAEELSFYCGIGDLPVPTRGGNRLPGLDEMFEWQWNFWLVEDLLMAIALANESAESVVTAPVKRVRSLAILDPVRGAARRDPAGAGGVGGGAPGFGGFGAQPGAGAAADPVVPTAPTDDGAPLGPPAIDTATPVARDFRHSISGRTSNHLYDVRRVEIALIVDAQRIPHVIDAFARRNFLTVIDLELFTADPFESIEDGYLYGASPVSEVRLVIESVWLREWTAPFMPAAIREALGVGTSTGVGDPGVPGPDLGAPPARTPEDELREQLEREGGFG